MADDKLNPEAPGPGGRLDPGTGAEIYVAAAADSDIDLSGLEAGPAEAPPPPAEAALPGPAPENGAALPGPAPENGAALPGPATENGAALPGPAPENGAPRPGSATENGAPRPGPAPENGAPRPGPAPENGAPRPGPPPENGAPRPGPAPENGAALPGPAPENGAPRPGPAPENGTPRPGPITAGESLLLPEYGGEDEQAGAAAAQSETQRAAAREAQAMDTHWLHLPYLTVAFGFLRTCLIWLWKQFKAIPPLDDVFDQFIFSMGMQRKAPSMLRRAGNLVMQGRLNEAVKWYRDILALRPLTVEAYDGLGRSYYRLGRIEESNLEFTIAENLERLLHNRDDLEAAAALALAFLDRRQAKIAVSLVEPVLISHFYAPTNSELLKAMGRVYQEMRSHRKLYQVYAAGLAQHPDDNEYYTLKGEAEQKLGNIVEGERLMNWGRLLKRVKDNPGDAEAKRTMGEIRFKERKIAEGLRFLREASAAAPDNADLRLSLAGLCFKERKVEEGLMFLRETAAAAPDNVDLRLHLSEICFKERRLDEGLQFMREAAAAAPDNVDLRLNLAETCFKERRLEDGLQFLRDAAAAAPDDVDLRLNLAGICFRERRVEEGLQFLHEAAAAAPDNVDLRLNLAETCFKELRADEGLKFLGEAAAAAPNDSALRLTLAETCFKWQKTEEGVKFLCDAAALTPDNTALRWRLYNLFMKQGNIDEALKYFLEIVALEPDNDDLKYRLADFYRKHKRREEALPIYRALTEKYPREPKPHSMLGGLLLETGQMEEGKRFQELAKLLSYAQKPNPDHNETVAFMKYLFSIGRHAEACEWLDRGLSKWPYHGELVMIKVKILYNEYQYKEAVTYLKRLISVRPDVAEPHIWIAMCYQRMGDNMAALAEAQLCTRLAPKSYVTHKVLGDILKEQKKLSQANAAYEVAEMMRLKQSQGEEQEEPKPGQRNAGNAAGAAAPKATAPKATRAKR